MDTEHLQRLLNIWPDAAAIRPVRCHGGHDGMYSFTLPDFPARFTGHDGNLHEHCGYWCAVCGFSSAGQREVEAVKE